MAEKNVLSFFGAGKSLLETILAILKNKDRNFAIAVVDKNGDTMHLMCPDYYLSEKGESFRLISSAQSLASIAARSGFCTGWYKKEELKDAFQKIEEMEADILLDVLGGIPIYGIIYGKPVLFGAVGVVHDYNEDKVGDFKKALEDIKSIILHSNYLWSIQN